MTKWALLFYIRCLGGVNVYLNFDGVNKTNRIEGGVVECVYTTDVCKLLAALPCTDGMVQGYWLVQVVCSRQ